MKNSRTITITLIGVMIAIIIGLFVTSYKSPISFLDTESSKNKIPEKLALDSVFPSLSPDQILVLKGENSGREDLAKLQEKFSASGNKLGLLVLRSLTLNRNHLNSSDWTNMGDSFMSVISNSRGTFSQSQFAFTSAKECYENALKQDPKNIKANNGLAMCIIDLDGQVMKGVGMLKYSLELDSNNIEAIRILGYLSLQSQQLKKAEKRFKKLLSLQPENSEYHFQLSEIYTRMGDVEKGRAYKESGKILRSKNIK